LAKKKSPKKKKNRKGNQTGVCAYTCASQQLNVSFGSADRKIFFFSSMLLLRQRLLSSRLQLMASSTMTDGPTRRRMHSTQNQDDRQGEERQGKTENDEKNEKSSSGDETNWRAYVLDKLHLCVIFGVTGSSTVYFVKPMLTDVLGFEGSFLEGPWSYRIAYICFMTPLYSLLLLFFGHVFLRGTWARAFVSNMWLRMFPFVRRFMK
jgi:Family of unknown function (DUF6787)